MSIGKHCMEPYLKENNLLQLSLFYFGKERKDKTVTEWKDENGQYKLECHCKFGVPGSFEQDVYTACMRLWVKDGMPTDKILVSYSDIARELNLFPPRAFASQIKRSLEKLGMARYKFTGCFIKADPDGNDMIDAYFSLFGSVILFSRKPGEKYTGKTTLTFPDEVKENLEAKYYQWLDMAWYRALPDGLPRRLYEFLEKRRYHNINGAFSISEEAICRWGPVTDTNSTRKQATLERIANVLITAGYLTKYDFDKSKKICRFTYARQTPPVEALAAETTSEGAAPTKEGTQQNREVQPCHSDLDTTPPHDQSQRVDQGAIVEALAWLDTIPYFHKDRKREIAQLPQLCELFPGIRQEYERLAAMHKRPKAGWVYKAFKEGYRFDADLERYDNKQKTQRQAEREAKIAEAKRLFSEGKDHYAGHKIELIEDTCGILIDRGIIPWQDVNPAYLQKCPINTLEG